MKKLFQLIWLLLFFASCQCDECYSKYPYVAFYMPASDTIFHPINKNDTLRVYTYYKNANWKIEYLIDSFRIVNVNWYDADLDPNYAGLEKCFVMDQKITPSNTSTDLGSYDFWLKSTKSDLQIKLNKMTVNNNSKGGHCPCDNYSLGQCYVNDSVAYAAPVKLW